MKAIYVLDEMPNNCSECPLSDICKVEEYGLNYRPKDCPLKNFPKKHNVEYEKGYTPSTLDMVKMAESIGRNIVIEELLGETKNDNR